MPSAEIFADSFNPEQDQQKVSPDLAPNCFNTMILILKEFFERLILKLNLSDDKNRLKNYPERKE